LGAFTAHAELTEKNSKLMLQSTDILWGDTENPSVTAQSHINDLLAFSGVALDLELNIDSHSVAHWADNENLRDLKPLTGIVKISDKGTTLGIDIFQLESHNEPHLSLNATGRFDDFKDLNTLEVATQLTATDLPLVGELFELDWPETGPVDLASKITPVGETLEFITALSVGDLKLDAEVTGRLGTDPPQIHGEITARNFFLPSFSKTEEETDENKKSSNERLFSSAPIDFEWLNKADLDLSVDIESFDEQKARAQSGKLAVVVQSGELRVSPATLVYPAGELNLEIELNAKETPKIKFVASGNHLNPWYALDMQDSITNKHLDTDLDVEIEVTSTGSSEKELAANLQGSVYMNMKNGKIRRSLLNLLFLDLVGWTVTKVSSDKYADVRCGVADFSIESGLVKTNGFFIDMSAISIAGEGTIDLDNEKIDYAFLPKKKSKLIKRADPVKIRGALNNPSISTIPLKTAITTYGSLFFAPYLFVGIYAADLVTGMVPTDEEGSPCHKYERKHFKAEATDTQP